MIQLVILANGDRILAEVKAAKQTVTLRNPMKYEIRHIENAGTAVVLTSYVQYASEKPIKVKKDYIVSMIDVEDTLRAYYSNVIQYNDKTVKPAMKQSLEYVNQQMAAELDAEPVLDEIDTTISDLELGYPSLLKH